MLSNPKDAFITDIWYPCLPQNKLGGGEGVEGIYGSITKKGMQKILSKLIHACGLGHDSTLVDIGAGLGR